MVVHSQSCAQLLSRSKALQRPLVRLPTPSYATLVPNTTPECGMRHPFHNSNPLAYLDRQLDQPLDILAMENEDACFRPRRKPGGSKRVARVPDFDGPSVAILFPSRRRAVHSLFTVEEDASAPKPAAMPSASLPCLRVPQPGRRIPRCKTPDAPVATRQRTAVSGDADVEHDADLTAVHGRVRSHLLAPAASPPPRFQKPSFRPPARPPTSAAVDAHSSEGKAINELVDSSPSSPSSPSSSRLDRCVVDGVSFKAVRQDPVNPDGNGQLSRRPAPEEATVTATPPGRPARGSFAHRADGSSRGVSKLSVDQFVLGDKLQSARLQAANLSKWPTAREMREASVAAEAAALRAAEQAAAAPTPGKQLTKQDAGITREDQRRFTSKRFTPKRDAAALAEARRRAAATIDGAMLYSDAQLGQMAEAHVKHQMGQMLPGEEWM